ncbi:uncharacterized protein PHALS_14862 [Plasmopara halstedii]|uniref:Uncharacterized protein n=1 Tax=Plasmopara halstedii TaxID=4781 RepID=A0A0P1AUR8_PLAHL|nr:uncharacterized protein PHALS_14862 [Plasmopara halstedii]CEG46058.1 hypothetical protein PHALS_14862 [Plasmopara halstedii]|eukprot:XP_024582427.1 hypothetical protein PHALS_14862 [Plasmopara halstedii]
MTCKRIGLGFVMLEYSVFTEIQSKRFANAGGKQKNLPVSTIRWLKLRLKIFLTRSTLLFVM